jgi:hypothetical protein
MVAIGLSTYRSAWSPAWVWFNPVFATYRLNQIRTDRIAHVLSACWVTSNAGIAILTALSGLLANVTGPAPPALVS